MSKFKLLILGLLTIGCGVCTNSVIAQTLALPPGNWAMDVVTNSTASVRTTTFGAQTVTSSKAGKKVGKAASEGTVGGSINGTAPDLSVRTSAVDVIGSGGAPSRADFGEAAGSINDPALDLSSRTIAVEVIDSDSVEQISDPDLSSRTATKRAATFGSHVNTPGVTPSKIRVNAVRQASVSHAPTSRNETNDRH